MKNNSPQKIRGDEPSFATVNEDKPPRKSNLRQVFHICDFAKSAIRFPTFFISSSVPL